MNKYAEEVTEELWQKAIDPDTSEYECFFHYEDDMLFKAGFEQALKRLRGAGLVEWIRLTEIDETNYKELTTVAFDKFLKSMK